ncbi:hypothetical protein BV20DRAFT_679774 [Pilatotrama ljubarskyi]|nr:hypothetical protein BV20DRAFT_679774 [Pilatotrama ljubarskyi]
MSYSDIARYTFAALDGAVTPSNKTKGEGLAYVTGRADVDLGIANARALVEDEDRSGIVRKRRADQEELRDGPKRIKTEQSAPEDATRDSDDAVAADEETDQNDYRDIFRRMIKLLKGDKSEEEAIKKQQEATRARAEAEAAQEAIVAVCEANTVLDAAANVVGSADVSAVDGKVQVGVEESASVQHGSRWEWCIVEDMSMDSEGYAEVANGAVDGVQKSSPEAPERVNVHGAGDVAEKEASRLVLDENWPRIVGSREIAHKLGKTSDSATFGVLAQVSSTHLKTGTNLTISTCTAAAARLRWAEAQSRRVRRRPRERGRRQLRRLARRGALLRRLRST